ncbi:MAG: hypothetical protein ACK4QW_18735 [Alphaproteobacteria bacterium]
MSFFIAVLMVAGSMLLLHKVRFRKGKTQPAFVRNDILAGVTVILIITLFMGGVGLGVYTIST